MITKQRETAKTGMPDHTELKCKGRSQGDCQEAGTDGRQNRRKEACGPARLGGALLQQANPQRRLHVGGHDPSRCLQVLSQL